MAINNCVDDVSIFNFTIYSSEDRKNVRKSVNQKKIDMHTKNELLSKIATVAAVPEKMAESDQSK